MRTGDPKRSSSPSRRSRRRIAERGDEERIWGSMVKQALRRRKPGFNESFYGYGSFNELLEDAASHGMLLLERDEKSGGYHCVEARPAE